MDERLRYPLGCIHRHGFAPCDCVPNHEPILWCESCEKPIRHVYVKGTEFAYDCSCCSSRRRYG